MDNLEPMMRRAVEALDQLADGVIKEGMAPSHVVALADAVSAARVVLYTELLRQGWIPPTAVPKDLALDEALAMEGLSSAYDEPVPPREDRLDS